MATHPDRTIALVIYGGTVCRAPDWPRGETRERHDAAVALIERTWGTEEFVRHQWPSVADDPDLLRWTARGSRMAMDPGAAVVYERMHWEIDVRDVLASIHVPTLIFHREEDEPEQNPYFAKHIPGAEFVQLCVLLLLARAIDYLARVSSERFVAASTTRQEEA